MHQSHGLFAIAKLLVVCAKFCILGICAPDSVSVCMCVCVSVCLRENWKTVDEKVMRLSIEVCAMMKLKVIKLW